MLTLNVFVRDKERDDRDRNRAVAPLVPAADALVLDSTELNIEQVIEKRYNMRAKIGRCVGLNR